MDKIKQNPPNPEFGAGMLVKLRDDLPMELLIALTPQLVTGRFYKIVGIDKDTGTAWLGPRDMTEKDITDFRPENKGEPRYINSVFPIKVDHLRKVPQ